MATQLIAGAFRQHVPQSGEPPCNVQDTAVNANVSAWTEGGTIVDRLAIEPPLGGVWSVTGWSIALSGWLFHPFTVPARGKLGRIIGGVLHATPTPTGPGVTQIPWVNPAQQLPVNAFGLATIWDGSVDPVFPQSGQPLSLNLPNLSPMLFTYSLSSPITLYPGDELNVGVWVTSALVQNTILAVSNATYTVVFDDGSPTEPGWGS